MATGASDEIFPEQAAGQIRAGHPGAEYHALPAGHFALEDKPAQIAALIRDFLARTVPPASRPQRPAPRGPGRPGATAGSHRVLTGQWRLIDRSDCAFEGRLVPSTAN